MGRKAVIRGMTVATMNDAIRERIMVALMRRKMTRKELASRAGLSYKYVCNILAGNAEGGRDAWERIFNELDLELTVKERGG